MARIPKYPATVVGYSETKSGNTLYIKVAFYVPKSKHVNIEFMRPGLQIPNNVMWGDRGFVRYVGSMYTFSKK